MLPVSDTAEKTENERKKMADLCAHGFTAGIDSPASEIAVMTMRYGVETAALSTCSPLC
ncbi:MAG: hypothetical protein Q4G19_04395 [Clostridia bacterium]|nr:hypothetical protein [Clostridia bacterium]